jgi:hypothetical protein
MIIIETFARGCQPSTLRHRSETTRHDPVAVRRSYSHQPLSQALDRQRPRSRQDVPTLVGIDHGFSFPLRYFEVHGLLPDWPSFFDDFQRHWPTDDDHTYVEFVRMGVAGNGAARAGNARWRRLTEERAGGAKSVFHFDVQGSVAKSTHAGIPWLRFIHLRLGVLFRRGEPFKLAVIVWRFREPWIRGCRPKKCARLPEPAPSTSP